MQAFQEFNQHTSNTQFEHLLAHSADQDWFLETHFTSQQKAVCSRDTTAVHS